MYEYSLTNSVNNAIQALCRKTGWKIRRITLKIGGLRPVNPELMAFIFAGVSKDTPAEGAIFSVMMIPVTYYCYNCKKKGIREDTQFMCPHCGSRNVQLLSGLEFSLEVLEVESSFIDHE